MSLAVQETVKSFDLFSKPFAFFVGKQKAKSTFIGGFLSLSVIAVAIIYFYYLMNLYFTNQVEPKITQSIQIESSLNSVKIQDSFLMMEMLINGQPLKQHEKEVNQVFLNYSIFYEIYYPNGTYNYTILPLSECTDSKFKGYQCIDQEAFEQNIEIFSSPVEQYSSDFAIQINLCDPTVTSNCASPEDIENLVFQPQNYFQVFTKIKQYNAKERQYQDSYKSEYFYFDPNLITYTRLDVILATTSVSEGLLLQKTQTDVNIHDYERLDTFFSQINIQKRMAISGLGYIVYQLNQVHNYIAIQHAMITETLAQFMSIFNALLIVGFVARYLAESYIIEDMNNILLQEYYKKTALKLVQRKEIKNAFQKFGKADSSAQPQLASSFNILNQFSITKDSSPEKQKSKILCEIQKKINETNFSEQQKQYFEMSLCERFKNFYNKILGFNQKIDNNQSDPNSDPILYNNLLKQSLKRINIFEVYKDLIKLKMAIKLILTKDQYAAIQFCGSDICPIQTQMEEKLKESQSQNLIDKIKQNDNKDLFADTIEKEQIKIEINNNQDHHHNHSNNLQQTKKVPSNFFKVKNNPKSKEGNGGSKGENQQTMGKINKTKSELNIINQDQELEQAYLSRSFEEKRSKRQFSKNKLKNQSLIKDEQNNIFETDDNLLNRLKFQRMLNSPSNQLHQVAIGKKDNIQSLKIYGDQNELNQSNFSLELTGSVQEEKENNQNEAKSLEILLRLNCHLIEMDKIEENEEEREKYLKEFFVKMNNPNENKANHIDQQIYQSLIINEKQVKAINCYFDQQIVINRRNTQDKKKQIFRLIEELNNQKKQSIKEQQKDN